MFIPPTDHCALKCTAVGRDTSVGGEGYGEDWGDEMRGVVMAGRTLCRVHSTHGKGRRVGTRMS